MSEINSRLAVLGLKIPEVLLPQSGIDLSKWAVIACDQHTQDASFWEDVKAETNGVPSAYNLIFPELYLSQPGKEIRIKTIRSFMEQYLKGEVFDAPRNCMIYLERSAPDHFCRRGLVLAVDLEQYDWKPGRQVLIRATEETIEKRLPLRMEIRRNAPLETSHILLLMNDEKDALLPALAERAKKGPPLYSASLMMNSGSVNGWALDSAEAFALLADGLEKLKQRAGGSGFLFAAGDGNHSLAAAKAVWEEYKAVNKNDAGIENHPARWALAELGNLYDPGIGFEPIHRIIFGADPVETYKALSGFGNVKCKAPAHDSRIIRLEAANFSIAAFQSFLDNFVKRNGYEIDYIHGEKELFALVENSGRPAVGLLMPPVNKNDLFKTVACSGPLPRKSFSIGNSSEKRFYIECRRLF